MAGKKGRSGRKTKLTPEVQDRVCQIIRDGNYANIAARAVGINDATYWHWLNRGLREKTGVFHNFYHAVKQAEADSELAAVAEVRAAARDSWQAAMTWLERRFRDRWIRGDSVMTARNEPEPVIETLTESELETLASLTGES